MYLSQNLIVWIFDFCTIEFIKNVNDQIRQLFRH